MNRRFMAATLALGMSGWLGCRPAPPSSAAETSAAHALPSLHLGQAQPRLPLLKLWVGDQELEAEVARRQIELSTGMMFRTNIAEHEAMLFVFPYPVRASFYMKNTQVPLTAAYLDAEGTILELHDLMPGELKPVEAGTDRVQFVLETAQGWFGRHGIRTGAVFRTPYGDLRDLNWNTLRPRPPRPATP